MFVAPRPNLLTHRRGVCVAFVTFRDQIVTRQAAPATPVTWLYEPTSPPPTSRWTIRSTLVRVQIRYGVLADMPYAELGAGEPLAIFAGLSPSTGFHGSAAVRLALGPLAALADVRRVLVFNRRPRLRKGMTMAELAAEHRDALRAACGDQPVDLVGTSTGGSIAQQLASDHPDAVRRLLLISTACRLGPFGRSMQRDVAAQIRRGAPRRAVATMAAGLVPPRRGRSAVAAAAFVVPPRLVGDAQGLDDMATTIEAEDSFDLARCAPVRAPTLLLAGRRDRVYSPILFEETSTLIPDCRLRLFDGRGHVTVVRDPAFRREAAAFLA